MPINRRSVCAFVVTFVFIIAAPRSVAAQANGYDFVRIADTANNDPGLAAAVCVGISDAGTVIVTFRPSSADGPRLWRGDGLSFAELTSGAITSCPSINRFGDVAYIVTEYPTATASLQRIVNGHVTTLATSTAPPYLDGSSRGYYTPLSNSGSVAFVAGMYGTGIGPGIHVTPEGTWVYNESTDPPLAFFVGPASLGAGDVVTFLASRFDATSPNGARIGIYKGSAPLVEEGPTSAGIMQLMLARPVINDSGTVAFMGSVNGTSGVYTTVDGVALTLVGTAAEDRIAMNESNTVAFRRNLGNSSTGIYIGRPGAIDQRVIGPDDAIDGSTFLGGFLWEDAINNRGQVAFFALLADGRRGIYRADPVDTVPPVVTAPASITIRATQVDGATAGASAELAAFIGGGTAVDDVDPNPVRLIPQMYSSDVTNATIFPIGTTTVTFRFQDEGGNIGDATADVTVSQDASYQFQGFFAPLENAPQVNHRKAGGTVAVKFSLGGDRGLNILEAGYPATQPVTCDTFAPTGNPEPTAVVGGSSLRYDSAADQYLYLWKTDTSWRNSCRTLILKLSDGTIHTAVFSMQ